MSDAGLYEQDFYLWTQRQAEALRQRRFDSNELEIDRLAEEIEDLGASQRQAVESYVRFNPGALVQAACDATL